MTFNANGGRIVNGGETESRTYRHGERVGTIPQVVHSESDATGRLVEFDGWYTEPVGGQEITETSFVT